MLFIIILIFFTGKTNHTLGFVSALSIIKNWSDENDNEDDSVLLLYVTRGELKVTSTPIEIKSLLEAMAPIMSNIKPRLVIETIGVGISPDPIPGKLKYI